MEVQNLRLFVDVFRRGSFAAVARDRGVDPSSISRAVAALETELGFDLFTRSTRRMTPTEAGERYLARIEPLLDELEHAAEDAVASTRTAQGTLRVLAPVSFAQLNVVPLLPRFLADHPGLRIHLRLTDALLDLIEERIDIAIRLGPLADSRLIGRKLATMRARVCASPAYLRARGRPKRPADLARGHDCLLLDMPGFGNRWRFRAANGRESQVDVEGRLSTSNAIALKQLALAGAGVILQGDWIVGREIAAGTLVDLFPDHDVTASDFGNAVWTLRPQSAFEAAKVRALLEFLHREFEAGAPWARA